MTKAENKELLRVFLREVGQLTQITSELLDKQLVHVRALAKIGPKYEKESKSPAFWESVDSELKASDVALFYASLAQLSEAANQLAKLATLKEEEQNKALQDYREVAKAFNALAAKLTK
jgi:hypothetical protein